MFIIYGVLPLICRNSSTVSFTAPKGDSKTGAASFLVAPIMFYLDSPEDQIYQSYTYDESLLFLILNSDDYVMFLFDWRFSVPPIETSNWYCYITIR